MSPESGQSNNEHVPASPVEKVSPNHDSSLMQKAQGFINNILGRNKTAAAESAPQEDLPQPVIQPETQPLSSNFTSEEKTSIEGVKAKADSGEIGGPNDQPKEPVENIQYNPQMGEGPSDSTTTN